MHAELRLLQSLDLPKPRTPDNPRSCAVLMEAHIGPKGGKGAELFYFTVVTPAYLESAQECRWGKGLLLVPEFSWPVVERMVGRLVSSASGESWAEVAASLSKFMDWEFENYVP
jgi:hypothetical protein